MRAGAVDVDGDVTDQPVERQVGRALGGVVVVLVERVVTQDREPAAAAVLVEQFGPGDREQPPGRERERHAGAVAIAGGVGDGRGVVRLRPRWLGRDRLAVLQALAVEVSGVDAVEGRRLQRPAEPTLAGLRLA